MSRPAVGESGLSRLDVAKMAVDVCVRQWRRMRAMHQQAIMQSPALRQSCDNLGQTFTGNGSSGSADQFLLLSTSQQYPDTSACAAGGRLLVGYGCTLDSTISASQQQSNSDTLKEASNILHHEEQRKAEAFQRELKGLQAASLDSNNTGKPFPDDAGGAAGLNAALSAGLQLISRYRLQHRLTEHFGMGRLPCSAIVLPDGSTARSALQPACMIVLTDGACLRLPQHQGGGILQLKYGGSSSSPMPLKEFYQEPFRWDQRIFVQAIGAGDGVSSTQYLHPHLRTLCEVTGGAHWVVRPGNTSLNSKTEALLRRISPAIPSTLPLMLDTLATSGDVTPALSLGTGPHFMNAGPVCIFQSLEVSELDGLPQKNHAMLLYTSSIATTMTDPSTNNVVLSNPLYCIPESYFPSKKLDSLPPRAASPTLVYSKYPSTLGSRSFDPVHILKLLRRLDQLVTANRKRISQPVRLLHRDVYICEWVDPVGETSANSSVSFSSRVEYFPVFVPGSGRPSLSDDGESYINIGILHVPFGGSMTLASIQAKPMSSYSSNHRLATLTLLPPEPQIILPLLLRAAEAEHRVLRKAVSGTSATDHPNNIGGATASLIQVKQQQTKAPIVTLDENWRNELRGYMFRLPPYYQSSIKRALRSILPSNMHSLVNVENGIDALSLQCFSKVCNQKIRNAEQIAREMNDRLERQEEGLRRTSNAARGDIDSYLAALPSLPAPWRLHHPRQEDSGITTKQKSAVERMRDTPRECLFAFYETRRRWLFGGPSIAIRGLHAVGVRNDGTNSQIGSGPEEAEECPLTMAGVGVSTLNHTTTVKMGEYRERLIFSRSPVVGYGSNDCAGVSATTAVDGSPTWSVDDDALPTTFFDPKTGDFVDSLQARARSKLMVNFGNPYRESRADSLIPEKYLHQAPSMQKGGFGSVLGSPRSSPGSPPQESWDSVEEGEAIFVRKSPSRKSPRRDDAEEVVTPSTPKRAKTNADNALNKICKPKQGADMKPAPPKPCKAPPPPPKPSIVSEAIRGIAPPSKQPPPPPKPKGGKALAPPPPPSLPPKTNAPPQTRKLPAVKPPSISPSSKIPPLTPAQPQAPPKPLTQLALPAPSPASAKSNPKPPIISANTPLVNTNASLIGQNRDESSPLNVTPTTISNGKTAALDLESPDTLPPVDLPPGWMCVWSKSQKRWYFFDTKTNKSVWKWPP